MRPALFGSWVAATALGDHDTAAAFAQEALNANPGDARAIAQLAYCYASNDRLDEAETKLDELAVVVRRQGGDHTSGAWDVYTAADRGLIAFRRGNLLEGRRQYLRAIEIATDRKLRETAAIAILHYVAEEACSHPAEAARYLAEGRRALDAIDAVVRPAYERILDRALHRALGKPKAHDAARLGPMILTF
jgi:tetratricopeptide (TPR) repeat protein